MNVLTEGTMKTNTKKIKVRSVTPTQNHRHQKMGVVKDVAIVKGIEYYGCYLYRKE